MAPTSTAYQKAVDADPLPDVDDNVRDKHLGNHQHSQTWRRDATTVVKRVSPPSAARAEAAAMVTAQRHSPSVPVPRVLGFRMPKAGEDSRYGTITMEYIDGVSLEEFWPTASEEDKARILGQLRGHMDQLRTMESDFIGTCNGAACNDHMFVNREHTYGPYKDDTAFREGIAESLLTCVDESDAFTKVVIGMVNSMPKTDRYVFTHGDLMPRNILVKDGNVVGIIDWEVAGFYPEYWEYAKAHIFDNYFHPWHEDRAVDKVLKPYPLELAALLHTKEIFMC